MCEATFKISETKAITDPPFILDLQWFAAEDEGRTETPSEFKIRKAREEGRVAKSAELPGAISLLLITLMIFFFAKFALEKSIEIMVYFLETCTQDEITPSIYLVFLKFFVTMVLPVAFVACLAIIIAYIAQFKGFIFSTKPIAPNFNKITPNIFRHFKRTLFSSEGLFQFGKSLFKVFCILIIGVIVIYSNFDKLKALSNTATYTGVSFVASLAFRILVIVAALFIIFGIIDFFFQKKQFMDSLKMSKQEVREEYKELEGDPRVKGQIRKRMQELLQRNSIQNVPEADVVITNPTHYAVALKYEQKLMEAPRVLAKGADLMAQRIKEIAAEHDIPIIENKPLTRAIYANVELGDIIPSEYYRAMSLVFAEVYALNEKKAKG